MEKENTKEKEVDVGWRKEKRAKRKKSRKDRCRKRRDRSRKT